MRSILSLEIEREKIEQTFSGRMSAKFRTDFQKKIIRKLLLMDSITKNFVSKVEKRVFCLAG